MSAATLEDLKSWFKRGQEMEESGNKPLYMVVVCDTYDWDDYPCYCYTKTEALKRKANPGEMQTVMEIYDLKKPFDEQITDGRGRCWAL